MTPNLDALRAGVGALSSLLADPQPGLATWQTAYRNVMQGLVAEWLGEPDERRNGPPASATPAPVAQPWQPLTPDGPLTVAQLQNFLLVQPAAKPRVQADGSRLQPRVLVHLHTPAGHVKARVTSLRMLAPAARDAPAALVIHARAGAL